MAVVDRFWLKMTEIYLHRWTSAMGETPDYHGEWAEMLFNLTLKQIKKGLDIEKANESGWPNPLPVFRANCLFDEIQSLDDITSLCIYWHLSAELKRRGLEKSKEAYYVICNADIYTVRNTPFEKARSIVKKSLEDMRKAMSSGYVLPEIPEEVPQIEHKRETVKFDLKEFMKAVNSDELAEL